LLKLSGQGTEVVGATELVAVKAEFVASTQEAGRTEWELAVGESAELVFEEEWEPGEWFGEPGKLVAVLPKESEEAVEERGPAEFRGPEKPAAPEQFVSRP